MPLTVSKISLKLVFTESQGKTLHMQTVKWIFMLIGKIMIENYQNTGKARSCKTRQDKTRQHPEKKVSPGFEKYCVSSTRNFANSSHAKNWGGYHYARGQHKCGKFIIKLMHIHQIHTIGIATPYSMWNAILNYNSTPMVGPHWWTLAYSWGAPLILISGYNICVSMSDPWRRFMLAPIPRHAKEIISFTFAIISIIIFVITCLYL